MPDQLDSNLNFEDRTQEVQRSIKSLFEKIGRDENEITIIYDQMNWGSLSNSVLYTALLEMENDLNLISADVVEVAPAYDHAELTSLAAATIVYELTNLFAKVKR